MHISVEEVGVIERKLTISVPSGKVETEIAKRLQTVAKNARVPGFRPGKAPQSVIKRRYSPQVTDEVVNETIRSSYKDAVHQEKIGPAYLVSIEPTPYQSGAALQYVATIELFPQIATPTLAGKTIEKPVVEVTDEDVLQFLDTIRKNHPDFVDKQGKSAEKDRLTIDFEGKIDGKPFDGGHAEDFSFIIGNGQMLKQFDSELVGLTVGETKTLTFTFPENYGNSEIDGKNAVFTVTVKAVATPELPELNDDFAQSLGIEEGIGKMKQNINNSLQHTLDERIHAVLHERVLKALYAANDIEVPMTLVEGEIDELVDAATQQMTARNLPVGEIDRADYATAAKKRVVVTLLIREAIKQFKIMADPKAVRAEVMERLSYEKESIGYDEWCRANKEQLQYIEIQDIERQVVDRLLETATIKPQPTSFKVFMNPENDHDYEQ